MLDHSEEKKRWTSNTEETAGLNAKKDKVQGLHNRENREKRKHENQ